MQGLDLGSPSSVFHDCTQSSASCPVELIRGLGALLITVCSVHCDYC